MKPRAGRRTGVDRAQETVNGSKGPPGTIGTGKCETCLKKLKPGHHGERKRFCSVTCRRLAWVARELACALRDGRAEGLRDEVRTLTGPGIAMTDRRN
jgi:endogenous inhibitor of DNA gyrase (YacG/DUF329 family)